MLRYAGWTRGPNIWVRKCAGLSFELFQQVDGSWQLVVVGHSFGWKGPEVGHRDALLWANKTIRTWAQALLKEI